MEIIAIPERPAWREQFAVLGLASEAATWDDGAFVMLARNELRAVVSIAEAAAARAKGFLEKTSLGGERVSTVVQPHHMAVQRLDFVENIGGGFTLVGIEVDPVEGFLSCALMQWLWIEDRIDSCDLRADDDQFNRLNETMLAAVRRAGSMHAVFDLSDTASAALAGYMVNLGIQTDVEVRPVHHAGLTRINDAIADPSGMPISRCWRSRFPGHGEVERSPLYAGVGFTTPAWYRNLPGALRETGDITVPPLGDIRQHGEGVVPYVSVWMVNSKAVACSCSVGSASVNNRNWSMAHVVR